MYDGLIGVEIIVIDRTETTLHLRIVIYVKTQFGANNHGA